MPFRKIKHRKKYDTSHKKKIFFIMQFQKNCLLHIHTLFDSKEGKEWYPCKIYLICLIHSFILKNFFIIMCTFHQIKNSSFSYCMETDSNVALAIINKLTLI